MSLNVDECYIEILRLVKQAGSVSRIKLYGLTLVSDIAASYADKIYPGYQNILRFTEHGRFLKYHVPRDIRLI